MSQKQTRMTQGSKRRARVPKKGRKAQRGVRKETELEEIQRKPKKGKRSPKAARRENRRKTGEELEWQ